MAGFVPTLPDSSNKRDDRKLASTVKTLEAMFNRKKCNAKKIHDWIDVSVQFYGCLIQIIVKDITLARDHWLWYVIHFCFLKSLNISNAISRNN